MTNIAINNPDPNVKKILDEVQKLNVAEPQLVFAGSETIEVGVNSKKLTVPENTQHATFSVESKIDCRFSYDEKNWTTLPKNSKGAFGASLGDLKFKNFEDPSDYETVATVTFHYTNAEGEEIGSQIFELNKRNELPLTLLEPTEGATNVELSKIGGGIASGTDEIEVEEGQKLGIDDVPLAEGTKNMVLRSTEYKGPPKTSKIVFNYYKLTNQEDV